MDQVPPSPPASRLRQPRWHDAQFVAGVVLVLGSTVAGAKIVGSADRSAQMWALRHALPRGAEVRPSDLVPRPVWLHPADTGRYLDAAVPLPAGSVLVRDVGAGELLPAGALAPPGGRPARRVVAVPVRRGHALGGQLRRGMLVDVVATYAEPGGRTTTRAVLRGALVVDVARQAAGFTAGGGEVTLLVEVAPEQAVALAAAIEVADLDVLGIVPGSDGPGDVGAGPVVTEGRR